MNGKISICIPTRKRPLLLLEALQSCVHQTRSASEILIGIDGEDSASTTAIEEYTLEQNLTNVRIIQNAVALGQAGNVHRLFNCSTGDYVLLLHDDDLLEPNALSMLASILESQQEIGAVYGKQRVIDQCGHEIEHLTQSINKLYMRTSLYAGAQQKSILAAIVQQFPNNGYLIRKNFIDSVGYAEGANWGDACDMWFGMAVSKAGAKFFFLNEFTACYRLSKNAVRNNRSNNSTFYAFRNVLAEWDSGLNDDAIKKWLYASSPNAVAQAARSGYRTEAQKWFWSEWHRPHLFSFGSMRRFLSMKLPRRIGDLFRL
jgi:glycosyltransferase involved in cell wall biosynthesis